LPFPVQATVGEVVSEALSHSRRLEQQLAAAGEALAAGTGPGEATPTPQAVRRYDQLLAEATLADAWNADSRAEMVLAGLGLAGTPSAAQRDQRRRARAPRGRAPADRPTHHLAAGRAHPSPRRRGRRLPPRRDHEPPGPGAERQP